MRYVLLLLTCGILTAADGTYTCNWASSQNGSGGTLRLKLTPEPDVSFTLGGEEVKTKVVGSKVTGENVEFDYEFEIEGYKLRSHAKGTLKDGKLQATYETKSIDDGTAVDAGSCNPTAPK